MQVWFANLYLTNIFGGKHIQQSCFANCGCQSTKQFKRVIGQNGLTRIVGSAKNISMFLKICVNIF